MSGDAANARMDADWSVTPLHGRDDICLVTVDLRNTTPVDRRVEVRNRLDGPVLPPRRNGIPEVGWDREGFAGVVPAGDRRVLGYACPAPADRPPISVDDLGRAAGDSGDRVMTAVRELGDPRPPIDATPDGRADDVDGREDTNDGPDRSDGPRASDTTVPSAVEAWLSAVEKRIVRAERLSDGSVEDATEVLDAAADRGDDVATLADELAADAAALRATSERTSSLADRAAAVDVPVAALRRLA